MEDEVLLVPKVINAIDGAPGESGDKVIEVKKLIIPDEIGLDQFEHLTQNPINLLNLVLLVLLLINFVLEAPGLDHGHLPNFDHAKRLVNQLDVLQRKLVSLLAEEIQHAHEGFSDDLLLDDYHLKG